MNGHGPRRRGYRCDVCFCVPRVMKQIPIERAGKLRGLVYHCESHYCRSYAQGVVIAAEFSNFHGGAA